MSSRKFGLNLVVVLAIAALFTGFWALINRPVSAPNWPEQISGFSYSPFQQGQYPQKDQYPSDDEMRRDLEIMSKLTDNIRTYSVDGTLGDIPKLAEEFGLRVTIGIWISPDQARNEREIQKAIELANNSRSVVRVVVGNEALFREEITPEELIVLLDRVRAAVKVPVTTSEQWHIWEKYPQLAKHVDLIAAHILPYWEFIPVDKAGEFVLDRARDLKKLFPKKPLLLSEVGWPSNGRMRGGADASPADQAIYLRNLVNTLNRRGYNYFVIEAFDQPWKRGSEGAVGGYWGLFDADRQDKGILAGPVTNLPHWPVWLGLGGAVFIATLLIGGRVRSTRAALLLPALGALSGCSIIAWAQLASVTSRYAGEWVWASALLLLNLIVMAHAASALGQRGGWRERLFNALERRAGWWLAAAGFAGAVMMLGLVFEPRYRSFPSAALLLPALVYLLRPVRGPRRELGLLAFIIGAGIPLQLYGEGLRNEQAWGWALVSALLVVALWRSVRLRHP